MPKKKKQQKNEEIESPETNSKETEIKQEKQTKFIIIFMIALVAFIILAYFVFQTISVKLSTFEYKNVKYQKVRVGYTDFYVGEFPIYDIYGNVAKKFQVYFYEDPRKLERISEEPVLALKKITVADVEDLHASGCADSNVASGILLAFLKSFYGNEISLYLGSLNKTLAEQVNIDYVNCTDPRYSVIKLEKGYESRIIKEDGCYILQAGNNCEINNVTEKFLIELYDDSYNPNS